MNGYYFECVNGRKNEHIQGSRVNNCSGRIFIEFPIQEKGEATQTRDHDARCVKVLELNNTQSSTLNNVSDEAMLSEIIREIIIKDPTIKCRQLVKDIREKYSNKYSKIMPDDVKYLVKQIKEEMDYNTLIYAFKNSNTIDNQPFLRGHGLSYIYKNKENKRLEYLLWISNSQVLRAINASHYYIDGTFDIVPKGFTQILVVMTNDPVTNHPKPLAYMLLSSKDEEMYNIALRGLKEVLTNHGTRKIKLQSITLDFETALINSVKTNFTNVKIIGCLFHLKNALWRWARSNKLSDKNLIEETSTIIDKVVSICWQVEKFENTIRSLRKDYKNNKDITGFLNYFEENYSAYFQSGVLDYADIDQHTRSNSCIESYHNQLQQSISSRPSWYELVEGLRNEEFKVFNEQLKKERDGELFVSSTKFSKKFTPTWVEKKCSQYESVSNHSSSKTKKIRSQSVKGKENKKGKIKKRSKSISKKFLNNKTMPSLKLKSKREPFKPKRNKESKLDPLKPSLYKPVQCFINSNNSCRYDSFLSFYLYSIYNSFDPCFVHDTKDISKELMNLYITCDYVSEGKSLEKCRDDFWMTCYHNKIDDEKFGQQGFITNLFRVFNHVKDFRLEYEERGFCSKCKYDKTTKFKTKVPLISIANQYRSTSFANSYLNLFEKQFFVCPECSSSTYSISKFITEEPKYLALIDDDFLSSSQNNSSFLKLSPNFRNSFSGNEYLLLGSINIPYPNHYSTLLKDPYFDFQIQSKGFYLYDGLLEGGRIQLVKDKEIEETKPYIAIYKVCSF